MPSTRSRSRTWPATERRGRAAAPAFGAPAMAFDVGPPRDCQICPRLAAYRADNRAEHPEWSNAPVASFGDPDARLLIVGLAPGVRGANRTGRPFTGDYAGDLLYATLSELGFAAGVYDRRPDDDLGRANPSPAAGRSPPAKRRPTTTRTPTSTHTRTRPRRPPGTRTASACRPRPRRLHWKRPSENPLDWLTGTTV